MPLQAVARERLRLLGLGQSDEAKAAEQLLISLLASACRTELQAGFTELGVAKIQASLEFALLAPSWSTAVPGPGDPPPFPPPPPPPAF